MAGSTHHSLVLGGSGLAGTAICKALLREGSQVMATYHKQTNNKLATLAEQNITAIPCDITQPASVTELTVAVKNKSPSLDAMVYAIGSFTGLSHATDDGVEYYLLDEVSPEMIQQTIAINTQGVISACQATADLLRQSGGGNIVLLGTLNGLKLVPTPVHLAAAKAALLGITQSLAKELGKDNIRINLVVPGIIDGPNLATLPAAQKQTYLKHSAMRRFVAAQEVAEVVSWFAMENTYMTGQSVILDGGL